MGRQNKPTIPQAWHQTKLAIKKNMRMPTRGAEGILVLLEALAAKCGLNLEEVVTELEGEVLIAGGSRHGKSFPITATVTERLSKLVIDRPNVVPTDTVITETEDPDIPRLVPSSPVADLAIHGVSGPVVHALGEAGIETIGELQQKLYKKGALSGEVTGVGQKTEDNLREILISNFASTD